MTRFRLHLAGPVRLIDASGGDRTPRAAKVRGMLALLGLAEGRRLPRAALIDKLWSDRSVEQARASLRQALTALRSAAGPDLFDASGGEVRLDPQAVTVILRSDDPGRPVEFAQGLEIRDREFEHWLRDTRLRLEVEASRRDLDAAAPVLLVGTVGGTDQAARLHAEMLVFAVGGSVERRVGLSLATAVPSEGPGRRALLLDCRASSFGKGLRLQPAVRHGAEGSVVWTQTFDANPGDARRSITEASEAMTLAVLSSLDRWSGGAPTEGLLQSDLFGYDPAGLVRADRALERWQERNGASAPLLAMRAYLRHTRVLERLCVDPEAELDAAWELGRRALELAPQGALGLAVGSLVAGLRDEADFALELAAAARRAAPDDPLVRHATSVALSFAGTPREAFAEATRALESRLAALAPQVHVLRRAYAAIDLGDLSEALRCTRAALNLVPTYRAALRLSAALEYHAGREAEALASLQALQRLEPDFSLDLMASDAYPVDTLRRAGVLEVTRSGLV